MSLLDVAIIGSGITGPVLALALQAAGHRPRIYELRSTPATIGGAINLTPPGIRLLTSLGVSVSAVSYPVEKIQIFSYHTGGWLGEVPFGPSPDRNAVRILRSALHKVLMLRLDEAGIEISYDMRLADITDREGQRVRLSFENGEESEVDLVCGCDGIHSAIRTLHVEPDRKPIYTGVASAMTTLSASALKEPVFFESTSLLSGSKGSLILSYDEPQKKELYAAAVMSMPEQKDKQGWRAQGADIDSTKQEILRRYEDCAFPLVTEYVRKIDSVYFYPIFKLAGQGIWSKGRVLCLGDAAHAMPPQGESMTLAIEDSVLFARALETFLPDGKSLEDIIRIYERTRKPTIDAAYNEAVQRWENVKDAGWLANKMRDWMTWAFLWAFAGKFRAKWDFDVRKVTFAE